MKPVEPKYTVIDDVNEKYYKDTDEGTAVTVATVSDDDVYYPVKQSLTASAVSTRRRKARRRCCGICCCITSSICGCFFLLLVLIGVAYYAMIVKGVRMITVETPIDFPIVTVSDEEFQVVLDEIETFVNSIMDTDGIIDNMTPIQDLIVPSSFVNGAISQSEYLRGHAQVIMKENEFIFQTSLPMDLFPGGKHRFFVSTLDTTTASTGPAISTTSFDLGKKLSQDYDGPLFVMELLSYLASTAGKVDQEWVMNLLSINVLGQEMMSPDMLEAKVDILQSIRDDPNYQYRNHPESDPFFQFINSIDSIRIEPDQMIIHARDRTSQSKYTITSLAEDYSITSLAEDDVMVIEEDDEISTPINVVSLDDLTVDDDTFSITGDDVTDDDEFQGDAKIIPSDDDEEENVGDIVMHGQAYFLRHKATSEVLFLNRGD